MKPSIKISSRIKAFVLGSIVGLLAYLIYGYLWSSNALSLETFVRLGWIFFSPQQPIYWLADVLGLSPVTTFVFSLTFIALLYGYIFLSFRLHQRLAIGTFLLFGISLMAVIHWRDALPESLGAILGIVFWQSIMLDRVFNSVGYSNSFIRIFIEGISTGFWFAALICGVHTLFQPIKRSPKPQPADQPSVQPADNVIKCANCHQSLRVPVSAKPVHVRCPNCQRTFATTPQTQ